MRYLLLAFMVVMAIVYYLTGFDTNVCFIITWFVFILPIGLLPLLFKEEKNKKKINKN